MSDTNHNTTEVPKDEWLLLLYEQSHSDIRWAKEQSWRVVNWALLLFAANLGIHKYLSNFSVLYFGLLDAAVAIIAVVYLADLHNFAHCSRSNGLKIEKQVPGLDGFLKRRDTDRNHIVYFVVKITVVLVSLVIAVIALPFVT
jgi:hypothetical protein